MATLEGPLDFTGTNGDPAIAGWDKYYSSGASSWEILTNQLVQATEYGIHVAAYDGAIDSDQWIELDLNDRASEGSFGIGLRHVSGDGTTVSNGVECFIGTDGSGSLYSNTGGELDTFTSATPPYTLRLEAEGSAVTLYRDDVEIASGTLGGGYRTSGAPFIYMGDTWQFLDNPMDNLSVGDFASGGSQQDITPAALSLGLAIVAPAVSVEAVEQTLTPAAVALGLTIVAPAISTGDVTVTPAAVALGLTVEEPAGVTITPPGQTVSPDPVAVGLDIASPTVTTGSVTIEPAAVALGLTIEEPAVSLDAAEQTVTPAAVALGLAVAAPAVTTGDVTVAPDPIAIGISIAAPTIQPGSVTVTAPAVALGLAVAAPTVVVVQTITVATVPIGLEVLAPIVRDTIGIITHIGPLRIRDLTVGHNGVIDTGDSTVRDLTGENSVKEI